MYVLCLRSDWFSRLTWRRVDIYVRGVQICVFAYDLNLTVLRWSCVVDRTLKFNYYYYYYYYYYYSSRSASVSVCLSVCLCVCLSVCLSLSSPLSLSISTVFSSSFSLIFIPKPTCFYCLKRANSCIQLFKLSVWLKTKLWPLIASAKHTTKLISK